LSHGGLGGVAHQRLHSIQARAYAHLGDVVASQRAIQLSGQSHHDLRDELHDVVGGEFGFSAERLAMSTSTTALLIADAGQAETAARRALALLALLDHPPVYAQVKSVFGAAAGDDWSDPDGPHLLGVRVVVVAAVGVERDRSLSGPVLVGRAPVGRPGSKG
jgi:hypothetical protein